MAVNNRSGNFFTENLLGLVAAGIVVIVLIAIFVSVFFPNINKATETGKSYINTLKGEIKIADSGGVGNFEMINLPESVEYTAETYYFPERKVKSFEAYLIYFGDRIGYNVKGHTFLAPNFKDNLLCVCVWSKETSASCKEEQCINLDSPAVFKDSNGADWVIFEGDEVNISKQGGKYVFEEVNPS